MRSIRVYILKLWVDGQAPDDLRGSLQETPDGKTVSFTDGDSLISTLHRLARAERGEPALPIERDRVVSEESRVELDSTRDLHQGGCK